MGFVQLWTMGSEYVKVIKTIFLPMFNGISVPRTAKIFLPSVL